MLTTSTITHVPRGRRNAYFCHLYHRRLGWCSHQRATLFLWAASSDLRLSRLGWWLQEIRSMRNSEDQAITPGITVYRFAVPPPKLPSVETMTLACKCVISNASYLTKQNQAYYDSVLPRPFLQGAKSCPFLVTCPFLKAEITPCLFYNLKKKKCQSYMAFSCFVLFVVHTQR